MGPISSHIYCDHSAVRSDIKKHGYEWTNLISGRPSLSLARHIKNKYGVAILQYHRATLDHNGALEYWKCIDSYYCLQLFESFAEGKYYYFVTNATILGNVRAYFAKNDSGNPIRREKFMLEATFHVLKAFQDIHQAGYAHLNFDWSNVWIDIHNHFYLGGFENLIPIDKYSEAIFGLQAYRPPEVLQNAVPACPDHLQAADMWALGVNIVEILTSEWIGFQDFQVRANEIGSIKFLKYINNNMTKVMERLSRHCPNSRIYSFVYALLIFNPSDRLTVEEALGHSWITCRDFIEDVSFAPSSIQEIKSDMRSFKGLPIDEVQSSTLHTEKFMVATEEKSKSKKPYFAYKVENYGYRYIKETHVPSPKNSSYVIQAECTVGSGLPLVAIKIKHKQFCLRGERFHWQIFDHDNVLKLIDTFQDGNFVFFVTEFMANQDVVTYLHKNNLQAPYGTKELLMQHVTAQVLEGFRYIHDLGMAHLKFSMEHVLLDANLNVRLGGLSHIRSQHGQWHLSFGRLLYRPPETLATPGVLRYNISKVDMWSLGASLMKVMNKKNIAGVAFNGHNDYDNPRQVHKNILDNLLALPDVLKRGKLNENLQGLLLNLLHYRPEKRMSADEALRHPWIVANTQDTKSKPTMVPTTVHKPTSNTFPAPSKSPDNCEHSPCETVEEVQSDITIPKECELKKKSTKADEDKKAKEEAKQERELLEVAGPATLTS